jgi:hypothetical protein
MHTLPKTDPLAPLGATPACRVNTRRLEYVITASWLANGAGQFWRYPYLHRMQSPRYQRPCQTKIFLFTHGANGATVC